MLGSERDDSKHGDPKHSDSKHGDSKHGDPKHIDSSERELSALGLSTWWLLDGDSYHIGNKVWFSEQLRLKTIPLSIINDLQSTTTTCNLQPAIYNHDLQPRPAIYNLQPQPATYFLSILTARNSPYRVEISHDFSPAIPLPKTHLPTLRHP